MFNIYNAKKEKIKNIDTIINPIVLYEINKLEILSFEVPKNEIKHFQNEGYIETESQNYVIKEIAKRADTYQILCKQNVEDFDDYITNKTYATKTLDFMVNDLLPNGWNLFFKGDATKRTVTANNMSRYAILLKIFETFKCEFIFDNRSKTLTVGYNIGDDNGVYYTDELNLDKIFQTLETHNYYTRIIPIGKDNLGIESVNEGKAYIDDFSFTNKIKTFYWEDNRFLDAQSLKQSAIEKLKENSVVKTNYDISIIDLSSILKYRFLKANRGDIVTVIDRDNEVSLKLRVIRLKKSLDKANLNELILGNKLPELKTDEEKLFEIFNENWEKTKVFFDVTENKIDGIVQKQKLQDNEFSNLKSQIKQTAEDITNTVEEKITKGISEISIGTRNFAQKSKIFDRNYWKTWAYTSLSFENLTDIDMVKFSQFSAEKNSNLVGFYQLNQNKTHNINFLKDRVYSISFDITNFSEVDIELDVGGFKGNSRKIIKSNESKRVSFSVIKTDINYEQILFFSTDTSKEIKFLMQFLKVEEGSKATSWTPAIEDTEEEQILNKNNILNIVSDNEDLKKKIQELEIENLKLRNTISTELKQTKESFEFLFHNFQDLYDENNKLIQNKLNDFTKYIRFKNGKIEIGEINSPFKSIQEKNKIRFLYNNVEVAYFSNEKLYVTDGEFLNSLILGNFGFFPRQNGNLSFKKIENR